MHRERVRRPVGHVESLAVAVRREEDWVLLSGVYRLQELGADFDHGSDVHQMRRTSVFKQFWGDSMADRATERLPPSTGTTALFVPLQLMLPERSIQQPKPLLL